MTWFAEEAMGGVVHRVFLRATFYLRQGFFGSGKEKQSLAFLPNEKTDDA